VAKQIIWDLLMVSLSVTAFVLALNLVIAMSYVIFDAFIQWMV